jgi:hypothetical protein
MARQRICTKTGREGVHTAGVHNDDIRSGDGRIESEKAGRKK